VEDYRNVIEQGEHRLDFGDAPDTAAGSFAFPTIFGGAPGDPARHVILAGAPKLGPLIDAEPDGQQNLAATGDDLSIIFGGVDDEDGITVGGVPLNMVTLTIGSVVPIEVSNTGALGLLNAWFDFNQDGTWGPGEQVALNVPVPPGVTVLPVAIPAGIPAGSFMYSRFRLSTVAGLAPGGPAPDGEVEDYRSRLITDIVPPAVVSGTLEFETRQAISVLFSEPLNPGSVAAADLSALNLDDLTTPAANSVILSAGNTVATWVFNTPGTFISDGDYSFTLPAGAVTDVAGNALAAPFTLSGPTIYYFAGDADRNRAVNLADFNIMAGNFGLAGKKFSEGNFSYDAAGNVNLIDFNLLAARFGMSVAPASAGASGGAWFSETRIADENDDLRELLQ
jgi:hypothetical protein